MGETETPALAGTNKPLRTPRLRGKEQRLNRKLNKNYLLVLEGLLRGGGWQRLATGRGVGGATGSSCLRRAPLMKILLKFAINLTLKDWVTSGQKATR